MRAKVKALAYLCSYRTEPDFFDDLKFQRTSIEEFAKKEEIELIDCYFEQNASREDFKPVLLNVISNFFGKTDKLIAYNPDTISKDENFRIWVQEELSRFGIELLYVTGKIVKPTAQRISTIKEKVKNIPSLPNLAERVIQLVQNENPDPDKLCELVSMDAGFTSKILKLVNSEHYGFSRQISTVKEAFTILGFTTIRGLVLSSELFKVFSPNSSECIFDYTKYWKHNLLAAIGAKYLWDLTYDDEKEDIFTAALLHDLGKIILARYDFNNYNQAYAITDGSFDYDQKLQIEERFCGMNHCIIAHEVADSWNFPEEILEVIKYHHFPTLSENYNASCEIVYAADVLTNMVQENIKLKDFENAKLLNGIKIPDENIYLTYNRLLSENERLMDIDKFFNEG